MLMGQTSSWTNVQAGSYPYAFRRIPDVRTVWVPDDRRMTLKLPLLAATVVAFLAPAAAQAATLSYEGDTLVFRADPGVRDSPMLGAKDGMLTVYEDDLKLAPGCTYD